MVLNWINFLFIMLFVAAVFVIYLRVLQMTVGIILVTIGIIVAWSMRWSIVTVLSSPKITVTIFPMVTCLLQMKMLLTNVAYLIEPYSVEPEVRHVVSQMASTVIDVTLFVMLFPTFPSDVERYFSLVQGKRRSRTPECQFHISTLPGVTRAGN